MEKFEKLRNIALPLESSYFHDTASVTELEARVKLEIDLNNGGQRTKDSTQKLESSKFLAFAEKLFSLDDKELNRVIEDVDSTHKINVQDPKTKDVVTATETLVNGILQAAGEIDERFKTVCIYSGSFYDDLKVGSVDEFDFVARIESLSKRGALEARRSERKRGFVYLVVNDEMLRDTFKEFLTSPDDDPCLAESDVILNVDSFQDYFIELLFSAIQSIDIPDSFIPVDKLNDGEVTERSWCPIRHGPCATLYLTYKCQTTPDVVNIDIDIAPSIAYPGIEYAPPVVEKLTSLEPNNEFIDLVKDISFSCEVMLVPFRFDYTKPSSKSSWHHYYSDTWRVSHSSIEKAIFSLYKPDSVEKKLCRILKVLKEIYLQGTLETEQESNSRPLKLQEPPSTQLNCCTIEAVSNAFEEHEYETDTESEDTEEYETFEDDSEEEDVDGDTCYDQCLMQDEDFNTEENKQTYAPQKNEESDICEKPRTTLNTSDLRKVSAQKEPALVPASSNIEKYFEVIYDRQSMVNSLHQAEASTPIRGMNTSSKSEKVKKHSRRLSSDYEAAKSENVKQIDQVSSTNQLTCLRPVESVEDIKSDDRILPINIYARECKSSNMPASEFWTSYDFDSIGTSDPPLNLYSVDENLQEHNQRTQISYRDSKPLLKTYMIKMLFLAMKTAYPDQESWKQDQLSSLLKMALCMIYYAYNSREKGILNFWFQDLIENRTRDSTCVEVLYCLEHLVQILSKKIT